MLPLSDQFDQLGFKSPQRLRRLPVSRATFTLTDREAFAKAVKLATDWIAKTGAISLSSEIALGSPFDLSSTHASASASRLDDEQGSVWAAKFIYRGDKTANRAWSTDLFVEQKRGALTRFGAQLICECAYDDPGFDHSRPKVIENALGALAAEADEYR